MRVADFSRRRGVPQCPDSKFVTCVTPLGAGHCSLFQCPADPFRSPQDAATFRGRTLAGNDVAPRSRAAHCSGVSQNTTKRQYDGSSGAYDQPRAGSPTDLPQLGRASSATARFAAAPAGGAWRRLTRASRVPGVQALNPWRNRLEWRYWLHGETERGERLVLNGGRPVTEGEPLLRGDADQITSAIRP